MKVDLQKMIGVAIESAEAVAKSANGRAEADAKAVDAVKKKHPGVRLYKCYAEGHMLIFRPPTDGEWVAFSTHEQRDISVGGACHELVGACLLHPSKDELMDMCSHRPAMMQKLAYELVRVAGLDDDLSLRRLG